MTNYPEQGDIVVMDFEPHQGHEMAGHTPERVQRPCVVVSKTSYNQATGFVVVMPITHGHGQFQHDLYQPILDPVSQTDGNIVMWQTPNFDYAARHGSIVGKVSGSVLQTLRKAAIEIIR